MSEHRPYEPISARRPLPAPSSQNTGAPETDNVEIESATDLRVPVHPTRALRTAPAYVPEARRLPGARVWAWLMAIIALSVALCFVHRMFVTSNTGQIWEYAALQSATDDLPDLHAATSQLLQHLPQVVGVIAILTFLVLTVFRRRWLASLIAAATFGAANLTTQVLKNIVLDRPMLDNGVPYYTGNSLPSGHTTFAAAAVVAVFLVVAPRWRPAVAFIGAVFATAVGVGTFVEAWHRPSDMVAAYLVAGIWGLVGGFVTFRTGANWNMLSSRTHRYPYPSGHPMWDVLLWLTGAAMLAGAWLALLPVGGWEALPASVDAGFSTSAWYLLSGALLAAGGGFLLFAFLSSFFRWEAGRKN